MGQNQLVGKWTNSYSSTLLNHVDSVFWWDTHLNPDGTYNLTAREVWLFNKKDGPEIIQKAQNNAQNNAVLEPSQNLGDAVVYPNFTEGSNSLNIKSSHLTAS